jgi:WD40 repeat protein
MSRVFISHVHADVATVERLAGELQRRGAKVWLDKISLVVGDEWESEIRRAIEDGLFFIACFSRNYLSRDRNYMNFELDVAVQELRMRRPGHKWFLPVLLDPIEQDVRALWVGEWDRLARIHHIRLYENWDAGVDQLISVIEPPAAAGDQEARIRGAGPSQVVVQEPERSVFARTEAVTSGAVQSSPAPAIIAPRVHWRAADTRQQREHAQKERVTTLDFDPKGGLLASCAGGEEKRVRLWTVPDLDPRDVAPEHDGIVRRLAFSPDGQWLATAGDDLAVRVWQAATGKERWRLPHPEEKLVVGQFSPQLAFSGSGTLLATSSMTGRLRVWDLGSGRQLEGIPEVKHVYDVAFAPFDRVVATADADGVGRLRDVIDGRVLLEKPPTRGREAMARVSLSADAHLFATVTAEGVCQVWQTRTGREVPELRREGVSHIAFSRTRRLMAATLKDGTLCVWEIDAGREVLHEPEPPSRETRQLLFRPDGAMVATLDRFGGARLFDIDDPGPPFVLPDHAALHLAFSPDSGLLATGGDAIVLWGPDSF